MKIAIIGNAGSGKSTLALKLHKMLHIPLYHLDQYFWKPGWVEPDRAEFEKIHNSLCDKPAWIIEGMAIRFLEYRIQHADVIIFLDRPTYYCFYRTLKRTLQHWRTVYFSSAPGCPERGPDLKFLRFIWNFNNRQCTQILSLLAKYNTKKIHILRSQQDIQEFLNIIDS